VGIVQIPTASFNAALTVSGVWTVCRSFSFSSASCSILARHPDDSHHRELPAREFVDHRIAHPRRRRAFNNLPGHSRSRIAFGSVPISDLVILHGNLHWDSLANLVRTVLGYVSWTETSRRGQASRSCDRGCAGGWRQGTEPGLEFDCCAYEDGLLCWWTSRSIRAAASRTGGRSGTRSPHSGCTTRLSIAWRTCPVPRTFFRHSRSLIRPPLRGSRMQIDDEGAYLVVRPVKMGTQLQPRRPIDLN
jgi:hypothetical protein